MIIRLILLIILLAGAFIGVRLFLNTPAPIISKALKKFSWLFLIGITLLLLVGKLNFIVAFLGAALAFISRLLPMLWRYLPQLQYLWRTTQKTKPKASVNPKTYNHAITTTEAYQILGLTTNATKDEVLQAHRKLMLKNHPDRGGSDYLAAQINQAKTKLLETL